MPDSPPHLDRSFTVALAQTRPAMRDIDTNLAHMQRIVDAYAHADLVVFPELGLSGYTTTNTASLAIERNDARLAQLAEAARRHATAIIFGAALNTPDGPSNAAVVIDAHGRWLDTYSKAFLFGDEHQAYVAGDTLVIVDLDGVPIGLMICFDIEFPEVARKLATAGAELLVSISANMKPFGPDHQVFGVARALENGRPHVYVNQIGQGETFEFTGGSMVVSPDGERLADAGNDQACVVLGNLRLPARSRVRPDYLELSTTPIPPVRTGPSLCV